MTIRASWWSGQRLSFFTDQFRHLVGSERTSGPFRLEERVIEGVTLSDWSTDTLGSWSEIAGTASLSVKSCICMSLGRGGVWGGTGHLIKRCSDTFQQMCWQHLPLSAPGTRVTPREHTPRRAAGSGVEGRASRKYTMFGVRGCLFSRVKLLNATWWSKALL